MVSQLQSPLHDALQKEHPLTTWGDVHCMPIALHLQDPAKEAQLAKTLALADASFLPRIVLKGAGAAAFLQSRGIPVPENILKVAPLENGGLIARTGGSEFLLESGIVGWPSQAVRDGLGSPSYKDGIYPIVRQDASLLIRRSRAGEPFRHASSYD